MKIKVGIISLGCSKNRVDTEEFLGHLLPYGFETTGSPEEAELIVVNTCGFITQAKEESIDAILEMAAYRTSPDYPCKCLVVTGCLSKRYHDELKDEMPEVDIFWGINGYDELAKKLAQEFGMLSPCCMSAERILTTPPYSAYLRISDGCYNHCSYCAIPLIRGNLKSRPEEEIIAEAEGLCKSGVTELNIIAQDTSAYGLDLYKEKRLTKLLKSLSTIDGLRMMRLLYAYPDTVTDELIECITNSANIADYIDMPIQHINDRILRDMNRKSRGADIRRIIEKIRSASSDMVIRTSIIVGFPGETEEEFSELLNFLKEYPIDRVGAFTYSPEENTKAALMPGQLPEEVKEERYMRLMELQSAVSSELNAKRIGKEVLTLIEGKEDDVFIGRSYAEAPEVDGKILIRSNSSNVNAGDYRMVRLTASDEYDMEGVFV